MEQYIIRGGNPLAGEVEISGAKNAALGILAAAIMTDETVLIEDIAGCPGYQCTLRGDGEYRSQGRADYQTCSYDEQRPDRRCER